MNTEEFEKAIEELSELSKLYKTVHPSSKTRMYNKYLAKLKEIAGETHMEIEDITMYIA